MSIDIGTIEIRTLGKRYRSLHDADGIMASDLADLLGVSEVDLMEWICNVPSGYSWIKFSTLGRVFIYANDDLPSIDEFTTLLLNGKILSTSFLSIEDIQTLISNCPETESTLRKLSVAFMIARQLVNSLSLCIQGGKIAKASAAKLVGVSIEDLITITQSDNQSNLPSSFTSEDNEVA